MAKNYVCNGAKIECKLCVKPEGTLKVTSNQIKVQDKIFATTKDKEKTNLIFQGNCKKSPYQAYPCQSVMQVADWQGIAGLKVQDAPALLESSTIMCTYGGIPIKITDHLQVNSPSEIQPVVAPVIAPIEDPIITNTEWKNELYKDGESKKKPDQQIEETAEKKIWMEATILNILPGEEIEFEIDQE